MRPDRTRKFRRTCVDLAPPNGCHDLFGGGGGTTQTTQSSAPWEQVQPYLRDVFYNARQRYEGGALAPTNNYATQAAQQFANSANGPLVTAAQNQLGATLGGDYLSADSNPYLKGTVQQALDQVRQNVSGTFSGDNFGSSANREYLTNQLAKTALPIYAQNYANERQNQLAATQAAPVLQSFAPSQLASAASVSQPNLDAPYTALSRYAGLVGGSPGGTASGAQPYYSNPLASALGLGVGGLSLYNGMAKAGLLGGGAGATDAAILAGSGVGAGVAGMSFADALAAGLIAL